MGHDYLGLLGLLRLLPNALRLKPTLRRTRAGSFRGAGIAAAIALTALACSERRFDGTVTPGVPDAAGGFDTPADQGIILPPDGGITFGDAPVRPDTTGACIPGVCLAAGGRFCGKIGDGCGGTLDCGMCPGGQVCGGSGIAGLCAPSDPTTCTTLACTQPTGRYCGTVGDGCGRTKDCGACPAGQTCGAPGFPNVCVPENISTCAPLLCLQPGGRLCGTVGDGCGRTLDCGGCPAGQSCGGDGTPGVCGSGSASCTPLTCTPLGGKYCGKIGDGCGKVLDCAGCPDGATCGSGGTPGLCPGVAGMPGCVPQTCEQTGGRFCGNVGDGCGGTLVCPGCPAGQVCGAKTANVCAPDPATCTALTCVTAGGRYCGKIGDGCGGTLDCGDCAAGQTCGGSGISNVCAAPAGSCTALTCTPPGGKYCGNIGDGCGKSLACGDCPAGQTCGGGGTAGICGAPAGSCTALSCTPTNGKYCGMVGDGCGKAMDCGGCPTGQTCGGGGTPGVCAVPTASCTPVACTTAGGRYCGTIGDGCGKTLACGDCPSGQTCGAGGAAGVCGATPGSCTPLVCSPAGGQYCGVIGDGCGKPLDCGACPTGQTCGGGGAPGVCGNLGGGPGGGMCTGLECQRVVCPNGGKTTITGTVFDPAGKVPLYNAVVYINNEPVTAFKTGVSCEKCTDGLSGKPVSTALTDTAGKFTLEDVPVGNNIPLVITIGKWRRQVVIPTVAACTATAVPATLTRLPRNKTEGEIPLIALTTGGADPLECLLRKIGIADSEFTAAGGTGRVHLYTGTDGTSSFQAGGAFANATTLWNSATNLNKYDITLLACEGSNQHLETKSVGARANMRDYTSLGGRVFASHWHNGWIQQGPAPWPTIATWNFRPDLVSPINTTIDQSFPKGAAMAQWLVNVGGSTALGTLPVNEAQHTADAVNPALAQRWIHTPNARDQGNTTWPNTVQYFTFNTPVGVAEDNQCGRVVYSDIHVSNNDSVDRPFPTGCTTTDLSPQEKALEFMFFDIGACIRSDTKPPVLPTPPPAPPGTPPGTPPAAPPVTPPAAPPATPPAAPPATPPAPPPPGSTGTVPPPPALPPTPLPSPPSPPAPPPSPPPAPPEVD